MSTIPPDHPCIQIENVCMAHAKIEELQKNQDELFKRLNAQEQGAASRSRQLDSIETDVKNLTTILHEIKNQENTRNTIINDLQHNMKVFSDQMIEINKDINTINVSNAKRDIAVDALNKEVTKMNATLFDIKTTIDKAHGGIQFFIWFFGVIASVVAIASLILKPFFTHVFKVSQ